MNHGGERDLPEAVAFGRFFFRRKSCRQDKRRYQQAIEYTMYPKKLGIFTPPSSAMTGP